MIGNGIKQRFDELYAKGEPAIGLLANSYDPALVEMIGRAGWDYIVIDGEHAPLGPMEMLPLVRAAEANGLVPLCRIQENSRALIQKVADIGVEGVFIPHVESAAEMEYAVRAAKFPRDGGFRSYCPGMHASGYSARHWAAYEEHTRENFQVIPILESAAAWDNLDEILAVDGVEYACSGPGDLAADLGIDPRGSELTPYWEKFVELCGKHDVKIITPPFPGMQPGQFHAYLPGMDLMFISDMFENLAGSTRELIK